MCQVISVVNSSNFEFVLYSVVKGIIRFELRSFITILSLKDFSEGKKKNEFLNCT